MSPQDSRLLALPGGACFVWINPNMADIVYRTAKQDLQLLRGAGACLATCPPRRQHSASGKVPLLNADMSTNPTRIPTSL
jgi:hypothetical protein